MLRLISILIIVFINTILLAQAPDTMWTRTFGGSDFDQGNSVQQTNDGGYIITGYTRSFGAGESDVWLIKTDVYGDTLWARTFGGKGDDAGESIQQTHDGGYIIVGSTDSFGAGDTDVWLIRTDANGDTLWTETFGDGLWDLGNSVHETLDGGYVITGALGRSDDPSIADVWLIKIDSNGNTLWTKTFNSNDGGCWGNFVQQTSDSGYIIVGETWSLGNGYGGVWLVKTDSNGDTLWTKTFNSNDGGCWGNFVQQTSEGGYIITGITGAGGFGRYWIGHAWLIKTDANGDTLWTKTFCADSIYYRSNGNSVQQTTDGGYIIAGSSDCTGSFAPPNVYILKTAANGDSLWSKTLGPGVGLSVGQTNDGGYVIGGVKSFYRNTDVWLIKVSPDVTSIEENPNPSLNNYQLSQNYPNPFNPTTTIEFSLPQSGFVTLKVYNILGEEVTTLVSEKMNAGKYKYDWDASGLASGVYLCKIQAGDYVDAKKMVLLR